MQTIKHNKGLISFVRKQYLQTRKYSDQGFSLIEIIAVTTIVGVLAAMSAPSIQFGSQPLTDTNSRITANLKLIRAKAMAQTSAYRIRPISANQLVIERAQNCSATADWSRDPGFADEDLTLDNDVEILTVTENSLTALTTAWSLCYDSRGMADKNLTLTLSDGDDQNVIEVFPGGTIDSRS
ncbi:MAG: type II secretion system protein [Thermosynechococcaceae cyanobacterium]